MTSSILKYLVSFQTKHSYHSEEKPWSVADVGERKRGLCWAAAQTFALLQKARAYG